MTKKISEYFMAYEGVCYPENEDAIYKQKYAYFTHRHNTEACNGKLFLIGGLKTRAEGPRKFSVNLESLKCHFLDFGEVLTEF
jgi:hypothetical protein